jgi:hypothetical protein
MGERCQKHNQAATCSPLNHRKPPNKKGPALIWLEAAALQKEGWREKPEVAVRKSQSEQARVSGSGRFVAQNRKLLSGKHDV